jgi:hypothetical protein
MSLDVFLLDQTADVLVHTLCFSTQCATDEFNEDPLWLHFHF